MGSSRRGRALHILLTNDDGIYAPGLRALYRAVASIAQVSVFAPLHEQSGAAHSITIHHPLRADPLRVEEDFTGYAVTGAPADCVRLAVLQVLESRPDFVLSGINLGSNVGLDVFYSGTVAAALEGALLGIPSAAISLAYSAAPDFAVAARCALEAVDWLCRLPRRPAPVLNVNVPALARDQVRGVRITRQGTAIPVETYEKRTDPRGRTYYWIRPNDGQGAPCGDEDRQALDEGFVSITPLRAGLTDEALYRRLRAEQGGGAAGGG